MGIWSALRRFGQINSDVKRIFLGVVLALVSVACATYSRSGEQKGLLQVLAELEPARTSTFKKGQVVGSQDISASERSEILTWIWPLRRVSITSPVGKRGRRMHEGVDLRARVGTPVYAVADGKVVYASSGMRGYGSMIVLRHSGGLFSVYAHLSKRLYSKGMQVKQGAEIAKSGKSGRVTGPHLHFEVRRGTQVVDPVALIPRSNTIQTLASNAQP